MKIRLKSFALLLVLSISSILLTFFVSEIEVTKKYDTNDNTAERQTPINQTYPSKSTSSIKEQPYIFSCDNEQSLNITEQLEENIWSNDYENTFAEIDKKIKDATDSESQLTYILSRTHDANFDVLEALVTLRLNGGKGELLDLSILNKCIASTNRTFCSKELLRDIKADLALNSAAWIAFASLAVEAGNTEEIHKSLQQSISAPIFNDYYSESINLFDRVLEKHGASSTILRHMLALDKSTAASFRNYFIPVVRFCYELPIEKLALNLLCLETGKRVSSSSNTIISRGIGEGLQNGFYSKYRDSDALESSNRQNTKPFYFFDPLWGQVNQLMMYDIELMDYWIKSVMEHGETKAKIRTTKEAIRISSDKNYNPCVPKNNEQSDSL